MRRVFSRRHADRARARLRRVALAVWGVAALAGVALARTPAQASHRAGPRTSVAAARGAPTAQTRALATGTVLAVRLEGPVTPVMVEALDRALTRAEHERRPALVVELDTPGGLEPSMRDMVKRMLGSGVPVVVWITPSGARAASAGVFLTMAADVAAMSPGTNIGAATPINLQGPMDSTLARKATNDAAAFARSVARQRGRNAEWAEDAVRHAVAASETEAADLHVIDFIAGSSAELLERADGRPWRRGGETRLIATRGLPLEVMEPGFRLRLMGLLADPNVAYLLMLLGFYGILFELQNPGAVLPGIVGAIALVLAFFALSTLPVNSAGVALIVLAVVFFLAEVKMASHGLLAAGGVLSLLLGSLLLFHGEQVRVSYGVIGGATLVTAAFFLIVVGAGVRAQRRRVTTGPSAMIGQPGVMIEGAGPVGRVRIAGVIWNARCRGAVNVGDEVEIIGVQGLTVEVRPKT